MVGAEVDFESFLVDVRQTNDASRRSQAEEKRRREGGGRGGGEWRRAQEGIEGRSKVT